jgi:AraC-like DNA-binding protein
MNWVKTLNKAIDYIEENLLDDISFSEIAKNVHISNEHLQRGFSALAGLTIGEYIRNRRLSLAGLELTHKRVKVIDIAIKYVYENSESFSKAFVRFHGIPPSAVKKHGVKLKYFDPIIITILIQGGFNMSHKIMEFKDIGALDDSAVQTVIRNIEGKDLVLAMKNSSEELQETIFSNISKRVAEQIRAELQSLDISENEMKTAQKKIVDKIFELIGRAEINV